MNGRYMNRKDEFRNRTKKYASSIIKLYCSLPEKRTEVDVIGRQMLRSGISVAGNYREASRARSNAEFISKIETCSQEADETDLWLELLEDDCGISSELVTWLRQETNELLNFA